LKRNVKKKDNSLQVISNCSFSSWKLIKLPSKIYSHQTYQNVSSRIIKKSFDILKQFYVSLKTDF